MADASSSEAPEAPKVVKVNDNEIIGRRLQKDHLIRAESPVKYRWDTFYDSRIETDLSVDHIGTEGNDKIGRRLVNEVSKIAQKDFELERKGELMGWAALKRKNINRFDVVRTPVSEAERPENPNPHHCEIIRSEHRNIAAARSLSYELTALAEEYDKFVRAKANT